MTGHKPCRPAAGLLIGAAMTLMPLAAQAYYYPCDPNLFEPVPNCEPQQQAPVKYDPGWVQGWAYYCTGDHPYYWGPNQSYYANFTWNNSCFSVAENWWNETTPNKFDATIGNWCISSEETIIVTLGCSKDPPPGYLPSCTTVGGAVPDPGCKQSNQHTYCQNPGGVPICFETYTETCTNDTTYLCTADQGASWCQQCQQ
jgi:hypothetical protein